MQKTKSKKGEPLSVTIDLTDGKYKKGRPNIYNPPPREEAPIHEDAKRGFKDLIEKLNKRYK